jgi:hypothetical protein
LFLDGEGGEEARKINLEMLSRFADGSSSKKREGFAKKSSIETFKKLSSNPET